MADVREMKTPEICADCQKVTYPPQGFCSACLSENMAAVILPVNGVVKAGTVLRHSFEEEVQPHLPLPLLAINLDCGTDIFALTEDPTLNAGDRVSIVQQEWPFGSLMTAVKE